MRRIVAHESRTIHLAWVPKRRAHEFRLMYGRVYLTPRLWLSPLEWYDLLSGRAAILDGPKGEPWLVLGRRGPRLHIGVRRELHYGPISPVPPEWPMVVFAELYEAASEERGERPEEGWNQAYEALLEAQRDEWGPA